MFLLLSLFVRLFIPHICLRFRVLIVSVNAFSVLSETEEFLNVKDNQESSKQFYSVPLYCLFSH